jgi:hypothetical protein
VGASGTCNFGAGRCRLSSGSLNTWIGLKRLIDHIRQALGMQVHAQAKSQQTVWGQFESRPIAVSRHRLREQPKKILLAFKMNHAVRITSYVKTEILVKKDKLRIRQKEYSGIDFTKKCLIRTKNE